MKSQFTLRIAPNSLQFNLSFRFLSLKYKLFSTSVDQIEVTATRSRLNRYLSLLLVQYILVTMAYGQAFELSQSELESLGEQVFANECAGNFNCLTSWNEGEEFPSLGIGHFIWFKEGQVSPFEETFPALLNYYQARNVEPPSWITEDSHLDSPWQSREDFYQKFDSEQSRELRRFLADTKSIQIDFIVQRLSESLEQIVTSFPIDRQAKVRQLLNTLAHSHPPSGPYALIDYVHFKGTGLTPSERYQNQGWGLKQVVAAMENSPMTLYSFVRAAKQVLNNRVNNAPPTRNEERWLSGWHKRVETYLPPQ